MEQPPPPPTPPTSQSDTAPPPQPQPPTSITTTTTTTNPNPNPRITTTVSTTTTTPFNPQTRPWQAPAQRGGGGGIAMGYPAGHPQGTGPAAFSGSFGGSQFAGGIARNPGSVSEGMSVMSTNSAAAPARHAIHGIQGAGIIGSQIRPNAVQAQLPQRPAQLSSRPQLAANNQSSSQNFQGHNPSRPSSVAPTSIPTPSTSQGHQSQNQPWLSAPLGRPPLSSPPFRAQMNPLSLQQRSNAPQQVHHVMVATPQQQHSSSPQQQPQAFTPSNQSQDHLAQNMPTPWAPQSLPNQQLTQVQGLGTQKSLSTPLVQPGALQPSSGDRTAVIDLDESVDRIIRKRSIQELVNQIDRSEHLDPEVEDVLLDIAEEFVDSITTFGCSLAKHRKSSTLEAKDILLHLERNWNMTLPGFGGDEIKTYRKPLVSDAHRERLVAVRKSMAVTEVVNTRTSTGQAAANIKVQPSKGPSNVMGS
ncbi:hypothetical protein Droror1_Dr00013824 [Drosera rotundifolia]